MAPGWQVRLKPLRIKRYSQHAFIVAPFSIVPQKLTGIKGEIVVLAGIDHPDFYLPPRSSDSIIAMVPLQQHPTTTYNNNILQQHTTTTQYNNVVQKHSTSTYYSNKRPTTYDNNLVQHTRATYCNTPEQHTITTYDNITPQQHTTITQYNNIVQQHTTETLHSNITQHPTATTLHNNNSVYQRWFCYCLE